jgi:DNA-binding CsgD family transcriptional regulator
VIFDSHQFRTVESHISSLLMKTGAGSRAALIALGLEARDARES